MSVFVLETSGWNGAAVVDVRLSTVTIPTSASDTPASTTIRGLISDPGMTQVSVSLMGDVTGSTGGIVINNADGSLDWLLGPIGRTFTLKELTSSKHLVSAGTKVAAGVIVRADTDRAFTELTLKTRDHVEQLRTPLLTQRYGGTTTSADILTVDGDVDMKDQIIPWCGSSATNVGPKLVNRFLFVWQVSLAEVYSIAAYDGAVPLTFAGDYLTLATLLAAPVERGYYVTCVALGLFRTGTAPSFALTADVVVGAAVSDRSAARVAQRVFALDSLSDLELDTDSFDEFHAAFPAEVECFVDSETQAAELLHKVMFSSDGVPVPDLDGVFRALTITPPEGTADSTFKLRQALKDSFQLSPTAGGEDGQPAHLIVLNYGPVWRTMSAGDVDRPNVTAQRAEFLQLPLRPATANDTVAVKAAYPRAIEMTFDCWLKNQSDAEARAARLLATHKVIRYRAPLTVPSALGRKPLGTVDTIDVPRFAFAGGRLMKLLGRTDDRKKRQIRLDYWG